MKQDVSEGRKQKARDELTEASFYRECASLNSYLARVGARITSLRRAVIEEGDTEDRYKRTVATISIDKKASCRNPEYAPTADEARAIEVELAGIILPKSIAASSADNKLRAKLGPGAHLLPFFDKSREKVLFVQQRIEADDGKGIYLPWSFWSDSKWRQMEPDGFLPLFGLEQFKIHPGRLTIIIHEGAKGADYWQRRTAPRVVDAALKRNVLECPWGSDLKDAIHLGWVGGALAPERTDWKPIRDLAKNHRVIVVCDNDHIGKNAISRRSRMLGRSLWALMFDDRFPQGFDLADEFPEEPLNGKGEPYWQEKGESGQLVWSGPRFDDFLFPATWATRKVASDSPKPKAGRPAFAVRDEFAAEWIAVKKPLVFCHRNRPHDAESEEQFNLAVRPFSDVDDTARLLKQHAASQAHTLTYRPDLPPGLVNIDQQKAVNIYQPPSIKAVKGDPKPFLDFMSHLILVEEDRKNALRWIATLIAKPEVRMLYAMLLISETQGVGKTTLAIILARLVGWPNVSVPSEDEITNSNFNSWQNGKRLVIIHEIYSGHSRKAYNRLKAVITEKEVTITNKYQHPYLMPCWNHVFASSNSKRGLHLDDTDRRWFVPQVTEQKKPPGFWKEFNQWLDADGLGIIRQWALDFIKEPSNLVVPGEEPPHSATKDEVIEESMSEGKLRVRALGEALAERKDKVWLTISDVREWLADGLGMETISDRRRLESPATIRSVLRSFGLCLPQRQFKIAGYPHRVVANFTIADTDGVTTKTTKKKVWKHVSGRNTEVEEAVSEYLIGVGTNVKPEKVLPAKEKGL